MDEISVTYLDPDYTLENFVYHPDCRYFKGDTPCIFGRPCHNCPHYSKVTFRVLIILLRRLGDILICSPLPKRIKRDYPGAHVTWLVNEDCAPLVKMNPYVDRCLSFDWKAVSQIESETYDLVLGFERTPAAAALVDRVKANQKGGLAYGQNNTLYPVGNAAKYFFIMNTWNDYRTHQNTKTWTQLYFEIAGFEYMGEPYELSVPEKTLDNIAQKQSLSLKDNNVRQKQVCINIGASITTKIWPEAFWRILAEHLIINGYQVLIGAGDSEATLAGKLMSHLEDKYPRSVCISTVGSTLEEFCAYILQSDGVITGDTFGLHVAIAFQKPTIALFGPSNPSEVVDKNTPNLRILRSSLSCSPCARQPICGGVGGCMDTISSASVIEQIKQLMPI